MPRREAPLRAVNPGEKAPSRRRVLSVLEAAEHGTRRDELVAMRRRIARAIDDPNCSSRDLAALTRRQIEISRDIEAIDAHDEGDEVGQAAATPDEEWTAT
jgi:hypothetical protein